MCVCVWGGGGGGESEPSTCMYHFIYTGKQVYEANDPECKSLCYSQALSVHGHTSVPYHQTLIFPFPSLPHLQDMSLGGLFNVLSTKPVLNKVRSTLSVLLYHYVMC